MRVLRSRFLRWPALILAAGCAGCAKRAERPDIVLVLADTLRADYLGCHGFQGDVSPNVDRLAAEGLLFERCFSQAPWTKPSVASLFTSLHPEIHGVTTHHGWFGEDRSIARQDVGPSTGRTDVLPDEALTLAEVLRAEGYETAAFVANPWIQRDQGFAQGFETYEELETKRGRALVDRALAWLAERSDERPFFLYVHFMDVHGPYDAPDKDYAALEESSSLGEARTLDERELRRLPEHLRGAPWASGPAGRDLRAWRGRYAAGVRGRRSFPRNLPCLAAAGHIRGGQRPNKQIFEVRHVPPGLPGVRTA